MTTEQDRAPDTEQPIAVSERRRRLSLSAADVELFDRALFASMRLVHKGRTGKMWPQEAEAVREQYLRARMP